MIVRNTTTVPAWAERPMLWGQLTLTEYDPEHFDPDFWLHYFERCRCGGAVLSSGGYIAFYPSQLPMQYVSRGVGVDNDVFGYLVKGCRDMGMSVICRTDAHAVHDEVFQKHPEWIAVDAEGNKRRHWSKPDAWVTCALGPYNFEFMNQVNKEIMTRYRPDAIFCNRWHGSGICYCRRCRESFEAATGREIPAPGDSDRAARIAYQRWREARLFELCEWWDAELKSINPDSYYIPNAGGGAMSALDMKRLGESLPILFIDRQARRGAVPPWANGKNAKELRATLGDKPIGGIFSVGVEEPYRWKDSVQTEAEIRIWVAEAVANGLRPWFTKFCATIHDSRWLPVVEGLYNRYAAWEPVLKNRTPLADVAVVYSQRSARYYGGEDAAYWVESPIKGVYHALLEARIPFKMIHAANIDSEELARFTTVVLPNTAVLSDRQCRSITEYVRNGGGIVATFETSLYDEEGSRRRDFGLAELFGVHADGPVEGPMRNSYIGLDLSRPADAAAGAHSAAGNITEGIASLTVGLEDAGRMVNAVHRVPVRPSADFSASPFYLIPSYPDLPMEEVYPREERRDVAEVFARAFERGRVVYFCGDLARTFWEVMSLDHGLLLRNAVRWAARGPQPVTVESPGVLDVTAWSHENAASVHIVNLTNPMMMKGPFREIIPVADVTVRLRLPQGASCRRAFALGLEVDDSSTAGAQSGTSRRPSAHAQTELSPGPADGAGTNIGTELAVVTEVGEAVVTIPRVYDHAVVVFELS